MSAALVSREEWRAIPGFAEFEVSSLGRVRRASDGKNKKAGDLLSQSGKKYRWVVLCPTGAPRRWVQVHILVAEAFHGLKPTPSHEVAHWDGDGTNNRPENLRWATPVENIADRTRHGRQARFIGEANHLCLHEFHVAKAVAKALAESGESYASLGLRFGMSKSQAFRICPGRSRSDELGRPANKNEEKEAA